jgi:hypothetical protein
MGRIIKIYILNCWIIIPCFAGEIKVFTFKEETRTLAIKTEWDDKSRIAVSSHCRLSDRNSCMALKKLDKASMGEVKSIGKGSSANPGTRICKFLEGRVVIGHDSEGNENSFCKFQDQSLIDCGTLSWYLKKD